ncbi:hypothetical protein TMU3MR103_0463 [Tetragenococcus muriaticus 3MR10-3]|uniref:Uncharacterized protein n=1 Tax=Tetragenococcus muriaticus 3MR10-3 TaxID=1302648 RepID=A0A091CDU8_9ENTE|nr:hypothetical protein TMU3MR103_0463 [Tetragenococcus muriaticus 3MR10-3]
MIINEFIRQLAIKLIYPFGMERLQQKIEERNCLPLRFLRILITN